MGEINRSRQRPCHPLCHLRTQLSRSRQVPRQVPQRQAGLLPKAPMWHVQGCRRHSTRRTTSASCRSSAIDSRWRRTTCSQTRSQSHLEHKPRLRAAAVMGALPSPPSRESSNGGLGSERGVSKKARSYEALEDRARAQMKTSSKAQDAWHSQVWPLLVAGGAILGHGHQQAGS